MAAARLRALSGLVFIVAACDPEQTIGPDERSAAEYVTSEAARHLDSDGRFILPAGGPGELTEHQAVALAKAYARIGSRWIGQAWERDRGEPIEFDRLSTCPRSYHAKSAVALEGQASRSVRQLFSPKWLLAMCSPNGVPVVSIAVSALATDLQVIDGRIVGPAGNDFTSAGIPTSLSSVPVTPEDAARIAAEATGRRVATVPELVLAGPPYPPQLAKWRIQLDGPVVMRGLVTGTRLTTNELYVGFGETWKSTELQLGHAHVSRAEFRDAEAGGRNVTLMIISGYPTRFERATVERP